MSGKLYLVATPIGNLDDITYRAVKVLAEADLIAAEDTRKTRILLNNFEIKKPLISYHEHNKKSKEEELINRLKAGENIALVSDAGTPCINDPGADITIAAIKEDIEVIAIPGASAILTALISSGLDTKRFAYEGFLPREKKERRELLEKLKTEDRTMVFYEAPHRLMAFLTDLEQVLGNREIAIGRELTKYYEETVRGDIAHCRRYFTDKEPKGEFTVVVKGAEKLTLVLSDQEIKDIMAKAIKEGKSRKEAAKEAASLYGISAKKAYDLSIE